VRDLRGGGRLEKAVVAVRGKKRRHLGGKLCVVARQAEERRPPGGWHLQRAVEKIPNLPPALGRHTSKSRMQWNGRRRERQRLERTIQCGQSIAPLMDPFAAVLA
jgi:hypothetical protein